jgi:hypothetical protein
LRRNQNGGLQILLAQTPRFLRAYGKGLLSAGGNWLFCREAGSCEERASAVVSPAYCSPGRPVVHPMPRMRVRFVKSALGSGPATYGQIRSSALGCARSASICLAQTPEQNSRLTRGVRGDELIVADRLTRDRHRGRWVTDVLSLCSSARGCGVRSMT